LADFNSSPHLLNATLTFEYGLELELELELEPVEELSPDAAAKPANITIASIFLTSFIIITII
jgi:hypothetical protein